MYLFLVKGQILKILSHRSRDNNFPIKISLVLSDNKKLMVLNMQKNTTYPYIYINTKIKNYENKILLNLKKIK